jgi:LmbE family N-acetylglucosaminyl deacetylase
MIRTTAMIALAVLALTPASAQEKASHPKRVLVVLAHPDDELFMAPAIAALARQGADVAIHYATSGDAGPGVSGMPKGAALAATRRGEAQCAARALGAREWISFGFGDGRLADHVRDGSLARAFGKPVIAAELVLTWGPDGGYGHADHRLVSAIVTQIAQNNPAVGRVPLLYVGIPEGSLPPVPEMADWATTDPALLTETIDYTPTDLEAAKAAAQCHVTQFDEATRAGMMGLFDTTMWRGKVHFRPAF